jgi:hypothetical protein
MPPTLQLKKGTFFSLEDSVGVLNGAGWSNLQSLTSGFPNPIRVGENSWRLPKTNHHRFERIILLDDQKRTEKYFATSQGFF